MPSCASFLARSRFRATQRALARCGRAPRRLPSALGSQELLRARPAAGCAMWSDVVWRRDTAAASCARTRAMGGGFDLHSRFFDWRAVLFVAIGFWDHRGGGACIFLARLLVVAWRAVVGGRHWTRTLACRGTNLRLHRLVATSVLRGLPAFYRSGAFCAFPAFLSSRLAFGADGVGYGTAGLGGGWHLRRSPRRQGDGR